jgi:hypothetical protein
MKWEDAEKVMASGGVVESQISFTKYEMLKNGTILAEGTQIDETYMTIQEKEGEWEQVEYLHAETKDDLMNIPDKDIQDLLRKGYKKAKFDMQYRKKQY